MKSPTAVLEWKAYRDVRWLALLGLAAVFVPSLAEAALEGHLPYMSKQSMILFGPLIALLMGVVITCRDMDEPLHTFWSSRPILPGRFVLVKFFVGLTALLFATLLPLLFELLADRILVNWPRYRYGGQGRSPGLILAQTPVQVLMYAVSFALGTLIRRIVPAALVALASGLLIWFGPILVPGISFLDSMRWVDQQDAFYVYETGYRSGDWWRVGGPVYVNRDYVPFALGMLVLPACALGAALTVVRRNMQWTPGQASVVWLLGGILLLLFWGGSRDLSAGLRPARVVSLPDRGTTTAGISVANGRGVVATFQGKGEHSRGGITISRYDEAMPQLLSEPIFHTFKGLREINYHGWFGSYPLALPVGNNDRAITIDTEFRADGVTINGRKANIARRTRLELVTLDLTRSEDAVTTRIDLSSFWDDAGGTTYSLDGGALFRTLPRLMVRDSHLIIAGWTTGAFLTGAWKPGTFLVVVYDISNPDVPRHTSTTPVFHPFMIQGMTQDSVSITVPDLPELSDSADLAVAVEYQHASGSGSYALDGDLFAMVHPLENRFDVSFSRITGQAEHSPVGSSMSSIFFRAERVGAWKANPFARLMRKTPQRIAMKDGLLYGLYDAAARGVEIWDVRDTDNIRSLGAYSTGQRGWPILTPLEGSRCLLGTDKLAILGP